MKILQHIIEYYHGIPLWLRGMIRAYKELQKKKAVTIVRCQLCKGHIPHAPDSDLQDHYTEVKKDETCNGKVRAGRPDN